MTAQEHSTFSQHLIILCIVKNFSLSKEVWYLSYVSGQYFVAHLIGVSVRNKFYIRTEEGASHISQYEGQLHYQDQARGCEFGLPTSAFKKPDVAPCSRNTSTGEAELLGASWPASLTIQQWFQCSVTVSPRNKMKELEEHSMVKSIYCHYRGSEFTSQDPQTLVPKASAPSSDILGPCTDVVHLQTSRWNAHTHK